MLRFSLNCTNDGRDGPDDRDDRDDPGDRDDRDDWDDRCCHVADCYRDDADRSTVVVFHAEHAPTNETRFDAVGIAAAGLLLIGH